MVDVGVIAGCVESPWLSEKGVMASPLQAHMEFSQLGHVIVTVHIGCCHNHHASKYGNSSSSVSGMVVAKNILFLSLNHFLHI